MSGRSEDNMTTLPPMKELLNLVIQVRTAKEELQKPLQNGIPPAQTAAMQRLSREWAARS
jgi:hypothetical protein